MPDWGTFASILQYLIELQSWVRVSLAGYLDSFTSSRDWGQLALAMPLGIFFGAVHAATPGHGKTVLASYLAGSRLTALRSVSVAGALSLTHIASAALIAAMALPIVTRTIVGAGRAPLLEDLSRGLLVLIGAWLLFRAFRGGPHVHKEREGWLVGVIVGLIPCPLTLFVMTAAILRGVPEAGLTFAAAMMIGVFLVLGSVALLTTLARERFAAFISAQAGMVAVARGLEGVSGALLIGIGLWRLAS